MPRKRTPQPPPQPVLPRWFPDLDPADADWPKRTNDLTVGDPATGAIIGMLADAAHTWQPGDVCRPYRGTVPTTVARVEGDTVHLTNGESMHWSHMRRVR